MSLRFFNKIVLWRSPAFPPSLSLSGTWIWTAKSVAKTSRPPQPNGALKEAGKQAFSMKISGTELGSKRLGKKVAA
jgi:hypothetical protein